MIKIDRNTVYESHGYRFKNFINLSLDEKLLILEWRNSDKVRSVMVNQDIITESSHLQFIEQLKYRNDCYYWLVVDENNDKVGVVDIIHVKEDEDVGELGFYINPFLFGFGLKFVVECEYFIYNIIKMGNNLSTVNVNNKDVLMLNTFLGRTYEGVKQMGDTLFYYNNHANGKYILEHYNEFTLKNYIAFCKAHKNIVEELKDKYFITPIYI